MSEAPGDRSPRRGRGQAEPAWAPSDRSPRRGRGQAEPEWAPREVRLEGGITLTPEHALVTESGLMAISDLHVGYEGALQTEGVSFPHVQARLLHDRLERLLDAYDPDQVIVCGDFKHNFRQNLKQEWREVQAVLDFLAAHAKVQLVRGNHDHFLATIAAKKGLELPPVHREEGFTFLHGHAKDGQGKGRRDVLVMGHEHPGAKLIDSVGATIKLPCYLHGTLGRRRVVVLPAFSPLSLHTDVSSARGESFLSPYLQSASVGGLHVTAVSEVGLLDFGTIRGLRAASGRL